MPKLTIIERSGRSCIVTVAIGTTILEAARQHNIDIEGACEGSLACSTCHVVVDPAWFDKLPPATEDEENIMDLAFNVEKTSRLGCQITITDQLDGLVVKVPKEEA